ncbi:MAG: SUMF1/EgtB/PvdO family nonheme iron enzyme [Bryobacteraceae bacterium]
MTLLERLAEARRTTDQLFDLVKPEARYKRPIAERHRIIFYVGHLEAFDWNLLHHRLPGLAPFDASLDRLFAFGIDPVDGKLPSDQPSDWPREDLVAAYAARVRRELDGPLAEWNEPDAAQLLNVAIEHRLMHVETLAYMLHQLPLADKVAAHGAEVPVATPPIDSAAVGIPAGAATLGRATGEGFGWDNEFQPRITGVPAFSIHRYKVTNGQFLEFLRAGGYAERPLWDDAGWQWKEQHRIAHPAFWTPRGDSFRLRTMFDEVPLPLEGPAWVSHAEASAYCNWRGCRLPTEAEWHRAAYGAPRGAEREYPWGQEYPAPVHGYSSMRRWDPIDVHAAPAGASAWGVQGLLGNGWEWTSTVFAPLPGFQPFPFYPGYSADFFDGRHYVLKGGSPLTEASMLRRSFRNWFQPHYQYVYAGFRCAGSATSC